MRKLTNMSTKTAWRNIGARRKQKTVAAGIDEHPHEFCTVSRRVEWWHWRVARELMIYSNDAPITMPTATPSTSAHTAIFNSSGPLSLSSNAGRLIR